MLTYLNNEMVFQLTHNPSTKMTKIKYSFILRMLCTVNKSSLTLPENKYMLLTSKPLINWIGLC